MLKWIVVLLIAVGAYFLVQNWSTVSSRMQTALPQIDLGLLRKETPASRSTPGSRTGHSGHIAESWSERDVGGLRLSLPFPVESSAAQRPSTLPSNISLQVFKGRLADRGIAIAHATNTTLVGGVMLDWANKAFDPISEKEQMDVISRNTATTLINGLRARRSDLVSRSGSPRIRARMVLLERGNQVWVVEYVAPETDAGAEQAFLRIANSVRAF